MSRNQAKTTALARLNDETKSAHQSENRWCTIVDPRAKSEIYFKYYCHPIFTLEAEETTPKQLGHKLLESLTLPKPLAINFAEHSHKNIFDDQ